VGATHHLPLPSAGFQFVDAISDGPCVQVIGHEPALVVEYSFPSKFHCLFLSFVYASSLTLPGVIFMFDAKYSLASSAVYPSSRMMSAGLLIQPSRRPASTFRRLIASGRKRK